jgi:hypothetical protein
MSRNLLSFLVPSRDNHVSSGELASLQGDVMQGTTLRFVIILAVGIAGGIAMTLGVAPQPPSTGSMPATTIATGTSRPTQTKPMPADVTYVFRATYHRTLEFGPSLNGRGEMAVNCDTFDVVKVIAGELKATRVEVRGLSPHSSAYPSKLVEGAVFMLKLTASAKTRQEMHDNDANGLRLVYVNGEEIEEK